VHSKTIKTFPQKLPPHEPFFAFFPTPFTRGAKVKGIYQSRAQNPKLKTLKI
jgi:hypothetical protein